MATMNAEIYDALMSAGADEEKARLASESVAKESNNSISIKNQMALNQLKSDSQHNLTRWMITFLGSMIAGVFWKLFNI